LSDIVCPRHTVVDGIRYEIAELLLLSEISFCYCWAEVICNATWNRNCQNIISWEL